MWPNQRTTSYITAPFYPGRGRSTLRLTLFLSSKETRQNTFNMADLDFCGISSLTDVLRYLREQNRPAFYTALASAGICHCLILPWNRILCPPYAWGKKNEKKFVTKFLDFYCEMFLIFGHGPSAIVRVAANTNITVISVFSLGWKMIV